MGASRSALLFGAVLLAATTAHGGLVTPPPPPGCQEQVTQVSSSVSQAIPDPGTIEQMLVVSSPDPYVWDVDLVTDVPHTGSLDVWLFLTSPAGTTTTLTTDNGGIALDLFNGTFWDDLVGEPVTDYPHVSGVISTPLQPEGALGAFRGESPSGTWTLEATDPLALFSGSLDAWTLTVRTLDRVPTTFDSSHGNGISQTIDVLSPVVFSDVRVDERVPALCDLEVETNIAHADSGDLHVSLLSPSGTIVTLTSQTAGGLADVFAGTLWSDHAATPVTDFAHVGGAASTPVQPEGALSAFLGEDPNGTWTLVVVDLAPGSDDGMLVDWRLDVTTCLCLETTPTLCRPVPVDDEFCPGTTADDKSGLDLKEAGDKSKLKWSWSQGAATSTMELGDPTAATDYALCLYDDLGDGVLALVQEALMPAGASWTAKSSGFVYKDKAAGGSGIQKATLKAGEDGKAKLKVAGKGANLALPGLPLATPARAQLVNSDFLCRGAVYDDPQTNEIDRFKAKGD